jgi:iron complex transport system ATP-binding protein
MMGQLSSGQRQRVLLARALAQEAPALLLDEPTTALDPEHQIGVLDLIHLQAQAGTAVLVVTHDLNLTSQYASRVVLLAEGGVAAEGTPEEVLRPEVLTPIYGACLWFGAFPDSGRPIVLPRGQ